MAIIIGFAGLILSLIGTFIISLSARTLFSSIHASLLAQQTTLEALADPHSPVPIFTGLDESREKEIKKSSSRVSLGLLMIMLGFLIQAIGYFPQILLFLQHK